MHLNFSLKKTIKALWNGQERERDTLLQKQNNKLPKVVICSFNLKILFLICKYKKYTKMPV